MPCMQFYLLFEMTSELLKCRIFLLKLIFKKNVFCILILKGEAFVQVSSVDSCECDLINT